MQLDLELDLEFRKKIGNKKYSARSEGNSNKHSSKLKIWSVEMQTHHIQIDKKYRLLEINL